MGWLNDAWEGTKGAVEGVGKAIDPWSDLSMGERAENIGRGVLAVGSVGTSELARAGYKNLKGFTDVKPADYGAAEAAQTE